MVLPYVMSFVRFFGSTDSTPKSLKIAPTHGMLKINLLANPVISVILSSPQFILAIMSELLKKYCKRKLHVDACRTNFLSLLESTLQKSYKNL